MGACNIQGGIGIQCNTIVASGVKDRLLLIPYEDLDFSLTTFNDTIFPEENVISLLKPKVGKKFFEFTGQNNSIVARNSFTRNQFQGTFTHEIDFIVFDVTAKALAEINRINKGRLIAIFEDSNKQFRVAGLDAGLRTSANSSDTSNTEIGGSHQITLSSAEELRYMLHMGVYTGTADAPVYDYAASLVLFDALTTQVV